MRGLNAAGAGLRRRRPCQTTCTPRSQAWKGAQVILAQTDSWQRWGAVDATGTCWAVQMPMPDACPNR